MVSSSDFATRPSSTTITTMRAAVLAEARTYQVEHVSLPEPAPHEVRVRVEGCGVCASNVPVWQGRPWFQYPLPPGAPGHEGWGVIDAVGAQAGAWKKGQRVAFLSDRAFAEFDVASADALVALPAALDGMPFPGEPLGCAVNVVRRSQIAAGQTVAIVGVGFLGALVTKLAKHAGARVVAISQRQFSQQIAEMFGADYVFRLADDLEETIRNVRQAISDEGCDVVIEATGQQRPLDLAAEVTRVRGRLVIAGYHQDGPRQVNMQQWNWRGLDVINAHERDARAYIAGINASIELVLSGVINPSLLYTHCFSLDELPRAMEAAETRPGKFLKALVWTDR